MLPLTYTRPVADLRVGVLKIREKWEKELGAQTSSFRTADYLSALFQTPSTKCLTIGGGVLPTRKLVEVLSNLKENEVLTSQGNVVAGFFAPDETIEVGDRDIRELSEIQEILYPWDIFRQNGEEIRRDFQLLSQGNTSEKLDDPHTRLYGESIFLEAGATVKAAILNTESGPIYLGKNSEVQEGAMIRGPFSLGEGSVVNMGAKIRGDTTVGPYSKVGGEVSNSVIQGYSNKGHDGFLGNAVLGEWCNLGADSNNSNLKNNYENVKMWDYEAGRFTDTGLQFCGLIMGDHSKCGINTMFNTGTSVGVFANIFGEGFPRNIVPSFAWGGASGFSTYQTKKAFKTADLVMQRRGKKLTDAHMAVLSHIFELTSASRIWERSAK